MGEKNPHMDSVYNAAGLRVHLTISYDPNISRRTRQLGYTDRIVLWSKGEMKMSKMAKTLVEPTLFRTYSKLDD